MLNKLLLGKAGNKLNTRKVYTVFIIAVVLVCIIGSIPYYVANPESNFIDCIAESVSSFTTTNVYVFRNASSMSNGLILYKAFCMWIGGAVSLVVLTVALNRLNGDISGIDVSENVQPLYRSGITFTTVVKRLLLTYAVMTLVCTVAMWISGSTPAESLVLAFSCVSTGGFDLSLVNTNNTVLTILLLFMLLTCINYTVYYHLIKKHFSKVMNSTELFMFLGILVVGTIVVIAGLFFGGQYGYKESVFYGIFESLSFASTSGYNIANVLNWPSLSSITLYLLSVIGGCTAAVGSGLKVLRIVIIFKLIARGIVTRIHPAAVTTIKFDGKKVSGSVISAVFSYLLLFIATFAISVFVISFEAGSIEEAFIVAISTLTNLGGIYVDFYSGIMKLFLCVIMLLGRLEFYACMIPFASKEK